MTNPATIPTVDNDPVFLPQPLYTVTNGTAIVTSAINQIKSIVAGSGSNCTKCINVLEVGQYVAQRVPEMVPDMLKNLCIQSKFFSNSTCDDDFEVTSFGQIYTQILALANVSGSDGQYICNSFSSSFCPRPFALPSNTTGFFGPKPKNITVPKPSGNKVKVLHLSDLHLDPRYQVGADANCSSGLCCRPAIGATSGKISLPAPLYGAYKCDSPYYLMTAALESIGPLTGTTHNNQSTNDQFAWTIFTGDLVSHDSQGQLSRNYTMYTEWSVYHMLKAYLPSGPVFPVLGNHDSNPGM